MEYHKINSVYKRDEKGSFIEGEFSCPEYEYLQHLPWRFTEKVDGTNIRLTVPTGDRKQLLTATHAWVGQIKGRTDNAQIQANLYPALVNVLGRALACESLDADACYILYGEGYGAGIQKGGGNYRPDPSFVLFDVRVEWGRGSAWLDRQNVVDIAAKLGIDCVPVVFIDTLDNAIRAFQSHGGKPHFNSQWPNATPEGVVGVPTCDLNTRTGHRIITKLKFKDFARR